MNVRLLRRVQAQILSEPDQFIMNIWYADVFSDDSVDIDRVIPHDGTAACIGGWTVALSRELTPAVARATLPSLQIEELAANLLGLPSHRALPRLFYVEGWPERFQQDWQKATTTRQRALVAADVIDDYISSDEWKEIE